MSSNATRVAAPLVFLVAASFQVLSPISVGQLGGISEGAKYLRLLTTIVIVLIGVLGHAKFVSGPASTALFCYVLVFVLAGLWSDLPHWAMFHKGMFALTCFSGLVLAGSVRSTDQLRNGLRLIGRVAVFTAGVALVVHLRNPAATSNMSRLAVGGINANMMGQSAAPMLMLCAYLFLNDKRRTSRYVSAVGIAILATVILATGSRGAAAMAIAGTTLIVLPQMKRARVLVGVAAVTLVAVFVAGEFVDDETLSRALGMTSQESNREGIWSYGWRKFTNAPLIGIGWLHWGTAWGSVQNLYLQTLVESGVVGGVFLAIVLFTFAVRWPLQRSRVLRRTRETEVVWLSAAFVVATLLHGVAESSTIMGTTFNALMLGFGIGLTDRMVALSAAPATNRRIVYRLVPVSELPSRHSTEFTVR